MIRVKNLLRREGGLIVGHVSGAYKMRKSTIVICLCWLFRIKKCAKQVGTRSVLIIVSAALTNSYCTLATIRIIEVYIFTLFRFQSIKIAVPLVLRVQCLLNDLNSSTVCAAERTIFCVRSCDSYS